MRNPLLLKGGFILALLLLGLWLVIPPEERIALGLDLRGGMHLVMDVETDDAVKAEADQAEERLRSELRSRGITFSTVQRDGLSEIRLEGALAAESRSLRDLFDEQMPGWSRQDLGQDAWLLTLEPRLEDQIRDDAVRQTLETIRERVDSLGVAEPNIQRQGLGGSRILVQLPGVDEPSRVKEIMIEPAFLEWKMVSPPPNRSPLDVSQSDGFSSREEVLAAFGGSLPADTEIFVWPNRTRVGGRPQPRYWPLKKASSISGRDLSNARQSQDNFGQAIVEFFLTPEAGRRFRTLTRENRGQPLVVLLDRKIITAPIIQSEIGDRGQIEGQFSVTDARDLALKLRSGALPATIHILEERSVGPSLGMDSIRKGVQAAIFGLALVVLFMLIYYRFSGINAVVALALNLVLVLGFMAYVRATLTLPGIAGLILTIGMAVDANVLIFERIREEMRVGKTVRAAVEAGFGKAMSAILDANITTIVAAVFLFTFGTGPIKGFAVTLTFGLLASMFTAIFVSRYLFELVLKGRPGTSRLSI
ncbi:MAG: protein translocase subunit SecD [Acidobacteriota bacterium]